MPPRSRHPMPDFVRDELEAHGLTAAYQQNDYLGWIMRGKHASTGEKRPAQMLAGLEQGDVHT